MPKKKQEPDPQEKFENALRRALKTPADAPMVGVKVRAKKKRKKARR